MGNVLAWKMGNVKKVIMIYISLKVFSPGDMGTYHYTMDIGYTLYIMYIVQSMPKVVFISVCMIPNAYI